MKLAGPTVHGQGAGRMLTLGLARSVEQAAVVCWSLAQKWPRASGVEAVNAGAPSYGCSLSRSRRRSRAKQGSSRAPALEDLAAGDGEIRARGVETRRTPGGAGMELQRRGRGGFGRPWRERGERDPIRRGQTRQRLRQFPVKKNREGASGERGRSEKDKKKGGEGRGRRSTGLGARERRRSSCRCCCSSPAGLREMEAHGRR